MLHRFHYGSLYLVVVLMRIMRVHAHYEIVLYAIPDLLVVECRIRQAVAQRQREVTLSKLGGTAHSFHPEKGGSQYTSTRPETALLSCEAKYAVTNSWTVAWSPSGYLLR